MNDIDTDNANVGRFPMPDAFPFNDINSAPKVIPYPGETADPSKPPSRDNMDKGVSPTVDPYEMNLEGLKYYSTKDVHRK